MGIDRRSWACQSKRASSSSDNEGTLVDASPSSPAPRNPATPQDDRDRGYCRESSLGRKEFPGGIGAVGSDRRPWVNQASFLEVRVGGLLFLIFFGDMSNICEVRRHCRFVRRSTAVDSLETSGRQKVRSRAFLTWQKAHAAAIISRCRRRRHTHTYKGMFCESGVPCGGQNDCSTHSALPFRPCTAVFLGTVSTSSFFSSLVR